MVELINSHHSNTRTTDNLDSTVDSNPAKNPQTLHCYLDAEPVYAPIDDSIEEALKEGHPFIFPYRGNDYEIKLASGRFVAYDMDGNVVDDTVQLNSKFTVDGFLEVRGLEGSNGNAVYIGNNPKNSGGEILILEGPHNLDRDSLEVNPHLLTIMESAIKMIRDDGTIDIEQARVLLNYNDAANYQQDNDPSINKRELNQYLMEELGIILTPNQLTELFLTLDANDSGNIRQAEFNRFTGNDVTTIPEKDTIIGGTAADPVYASDIEFVRPNSDGPTISPIVGYNWRPYKNEQWMENEDHWEWPMVQQSMMDRDTTEYWDNLVDELLFSGVDVISFHGRGAWYPDDPTMIGKGSGDMDPRLLTHFVEALDRAGARDAVKIAMWDDTGMYDGAWQRATGNEKFDLSDPAVWDFMYESNIKLFFETVPRDLWYTNDEGQPLISMWTLISETFINMEGNLSQALNHIAERFAQDFGVEPEFIVQKKWFEKDSTMPESEHVLGMHNWIKPADNILGRYEEYNDFVAGVVAPGFRPPVGHERQDRFVERDNGLRLTEALQDGMDQNADFILLEGWTNQIEGAGFYRSNEWETPNQYINIVRRFANPEPESIRFQAEGADRFYDTTRGNTLGDYADRGLDVERYETFDDEGQLETSGWYVGNTEPGEWIEYSDIDLGEGDYRVTIRIATEGTSEVKLNLPGLESVTLPDTNGEFQLFHLGETHLEDGIYDLRLELESQGLKVDWFHVRKIDGDK